VLLDNLVVVSVVVVAAVDVRFYNDVRFLIVVDVNVFFEHQQNATRFY